MATGVMYGYGAICATIRLILCEFGLSGSETATSLGKRPPSMELLV
ncbi:hypothetical protein [Novosphingobium sp.]|nr:hypothetical protein [Novosphingobium sp.]